MEKITIMNINIDEISLDETKDCIDQYLNNDCLNTVILLNSQALLLVDQDEELASYIAQSDLVIPGDKTAVEVVENIIKRDYKAVFGMHFVDALFESAIEYGKTLYLLSDRSEDGRRQEETIRELYPEVSLAGANNLEQELDEEGLVNEINGAAPDIVLVSVESPLQEKLIMNNRDKWNAKLCVALGKDPDLVLLKNKGIGLFKQLINKSVLLRKARKYEEPEDDLESEDEMEDDDGDKE